MLTFRGLRGRGSRRSCLASGPRRLKKIGPPKGPIPVVLLTVCVDGKAEKGSFRVQVSMANVVITTFYGNLESP